MRTWEKIGHVIVTLHCVCLTLHFPRGRLIFIYPGLFPLPWWVNVSLLWILHQKNFIVISFSTGIWLHESGVLGESPDALISTAPNKSFPVHCQTAAALTVQPQLVQVKCPFTAKDITVQEATSTLKNVYISMLHFINLVMPNHILPFDITDTRSLLVMILALLYAHKK